MSVIKDQSARLSKRLNVSDYVFGLWVLSIPFNKYAVFGGMSFDNVLTPLVVVLWIVVSPTLNINKERKKNITIAFVLCGIYTFFSVARALNAGQYDVVLSEVFLQSRFIIYFLLPILLIDTADRFYRFLRLLTIDMIIVSASAFAVALGFIDLGPREIMSRLEGFERSAGLLGGVGPMAALISLAILVRFIEKKIAKKSIFKTTLFGAVVFCSIAVGVISAQSRNVIITVLIVVLLYLVVRLLAKRNLLQIIIGAFLFIPLLVLFSFAMNAIWELIYSTTLGTGGLRGTMNDRFDSYGHAINLLKGNIWVGISAEQRLSNEEFLATLHSIWLNILLKGGVLALLSFLAICLYGALNALYIAKTHLRYSTEGHVFFVYTIGLLFSASFYVAQLNHIFWVCLSLSYCFIGLKLDGDKHSVHKASDIIQDSINSRNKLNTKTVLRSRR